MGSEAEISEVHSLPIHKHYSRIDPHLLASTHTLNCRRLPATSTKWKHKCSVPREIFGIRSELCSEEQVQRQKKGKSYFYQLCNYLHSH